MKVIRGHLFFVFACGCAMAGRHRAEMPLPHDCIGPPMQPVPFTSQDWPQLVGTYRLIIVQTSDGGTPGVSRETLVLDRADSATRYAPIPSLGQRTARSDRPLIGSVRA